MPPKLRDYFDPATGLAAACLMGAIVWAINASHGSLPATTAALKQAAYTFLMGGLIARLCRYLAVRPWPSPLPLLAGILIPSFITTAATYGVHSLKGTPEPLLSTLPVFLISPPFFALWSWGLRRRGKDLLPIESINPHGEQP